MNNTGFPFGRPPPTLSWSIIEQGRLAYSGEGTQEMRRLLMLCVLIVTGCQNVVGPFEHRQARRVDDPCLPIPEQQRWGRDRYAWQYESSSALPSTGAQLPGPHDR